MIDEQGQNPMVIIAEQCGVVDKIEQLQLTKNQNVYEKSISILENYFQLEEQEDIMEMLYQPNEMTAGNTMAGTESSSLFCNTSTTDAQQNQHNFQL